MDYETIILKIRNGEYETKLEYPKINRFKESYVFDENQSVKWNREEVLRKNEESVANKTAYRNSKEQKLEEFENDIIVHIVDNFSLHNLEIANKIYLKAYEEGHSGGYYEILNYAIDFADFVSDILDLV